MLSYNISLLFPSTKLLMITLTTGIIFPLILFFLFVILCGIAAFLLIHFKNGSSKKEKQKNTAAICEINPMYNSFYVNNKNLKLPKMTTSMKVDELNKDLEPFGFAYYPTEDYFYSIMNGWQRQCGYCELYDEGAAALSMIIDCEPIRFEYNGKKWLIEFWKGQYGMNTGCEIGIYNTDGPNLNIPDFFDGTFYYSAKDDEHLPLSFSLIKNGKLIFTRSQVHWWLTAFKLGEFSDPSELTMTAQITLKDSIMRDAFINGMHEAGFSNNEFTVTGNTIRFVFKTPHSPQPVTRTELTEYIMQTNNKRYCEAYQFATKSLGNPLDKMELVKIQAPKMYHKIINVGNTKELFEKYNSINNFLDH